MRFINSNKNKWYNGTITTHMFIIIIIIIKKIYIYNIFLIFLQPIISDILLLVITITIKK